MTTEAAALNEDRTHDNRACTTFHPWWEKCPPTKPRCKVCGKGLPDEEWSDCDSCTFDAWAASMERAEED
jgi:hypothetical protein